MPRMGIRLFIKSVSNMNKIFARNQKPVPMIHLAVARVA